MRIATVTAEGLHFRARASDKAAVIDSLTRGDEIEIDPTSAAVGDWYHGRISRIANGVAEKSRTKQWGWFYSVGTVSIRSVNAPPPQPKVLIQDRRNSIPPWMWLPASVLVLVALGWLLWR